MQNDLESIINERNLKKTTYENELASKKESNRHAIESLKAKLDDYLVKKKEEIVEEEEEIDIKAVQQELKDIDKQIEEGIKHMVTCSATEDPVEMSKCSKYADELKLPYVKNYI